MSHRFGLKQGNKNICINIYIYIFVPRYIYFDGKNKKILILYLEVNR